jgi:hypothetical protein
MGGRRQTRPGKGGSSNAEPSIYVALNALVEAFCKHPEFVKSPRRNSESTAPVQVPMTEVDAGRNLSIEIGLIALQPSQEARSNSAAPIRDRFVNVELTDAGRCLVREFTDLGDMLAYLTGKQMLRPSWNASRRELRYRGVIVKRFTRSAENQELLLTAFEEANWQLKIDDPLPPRGKVRQKDRLRATVKNLNRTILPHTIGFGVNNHGTQATWHLQ